MKKETIDFLTSINKGIIYYIQDNKIFYKSKPLRISENKNTIDVIIHNMYATISRNETDKEKINLFASNLESIYCRSIRFDIQDTNRKKVDVKINELYNTVPSKYKEYIKVTGSNIKRFENCVGYTQELTINFSYIDIANHKRIKDFLEPQETTALKDRLDLSLYTQSIVDRLNKELQAWKQENNIILLFQNIKVEEHPIFI